MYSTLKTPAGVVLLRTTQYLDARESVALATFTNPAAADTAGVWMTKLAQNAATWAADSAGLDNDRSLSHQVLYAYGDATAPADASKLVAGAAKLGAAVRAEPIEVRTALLEELTMACVGFDQPIVTATVRTDDGNYEVTFAVNQWLTVADDDRLETLAAAGWGGDYCADEIAHDLATQLSDFWGYIAATAAGYEVHVDVEAATRWVHANRPHVKI